ncbi:antibiotic biosynthesis monooxygenase family protein [Marinithermus hydrothermalis]|uniref:Antibiotic biosynthesis monooxygenase n=1 Tax=Marinithermus hydrothermalis (strain DSM 14884 / JCM 11576 / T1) TaxID=869210 RepID=F2NKW3_MARHT|nr:antibiotic biosynthesis monooxygenase [Marinithermus hydrothermalis]AEB11152.1 Antibiotic biosynthesis monooxygenase [Marinithermus hydrothermalis DSM 14884]
MYVVMNRIYVNPEYREAFEARFQGRAREIDRMPGFIRNLVLRPDRPGAPYVVMTFWRSKQDFEAWVDSEAFRKGHARSGTLPKEAFSRRNELETFEAFLDSEA